MEDVTIVRLNSEAAFTRVNADAAINEGEEFILLENKSIFNFSIDVTNVDKDTKGAVFAKQSLDGYIDQTSTFATFKASSFESNQNVKFTFTDKDRGQTVDLQIDEKMYVLAVAKKYTIRAWTEGANVRTITAVKQTTETCWFHAVMFVLLESPVLDGMELMRSVLKALGCSMRKRMENNRAPMVLDGVRKGLFETSIELDHQQYKGASLSSIPELRYLSQKPRTDLEDMEEPQRSAKIMQHVREYNGRYPYSDVSGRTDAFASRVVSPKQPMLSKSDIKPSGFASDPDLDEVRRREDEKTGSPTNSRNAYACDITCFRNLRKVLKFPAIESDGGWELYLAYNTLRYFTPGKPSPVIVPFHNTDATDDVVLNIINSIVGQDALVTDPVRLLTDPDPSGPIRTYPDLSGDTDFVLAHLAFVHASDSVEGMLAEIKRTCGPVIAGPDPAAWMSAGILVASALTSHAVSLIPSRAGEGKWLYRDSKLAEIQTTDDPITQLTKFFKDNKNLRALRHPSYPFISIELTFIFKRQAGQAVPGQGLRPINFMDDRLVGKKDRPRVLLDGGYSGGGTSLKNNGIERAVLASVVSFLALACQLF
jgi:hypothetical protein